MDFLDKELNRYVEKHTTPASALLDEIERTTYQKVLRPRMISGHLQGRILSMIAKLYRPTYVLEIGTYTGYSALCLAEGLQPNGQLVTIDKNIELEGMVREWFSRSPWGDQIRFEVGDARSIIPTLNFTWDLVFIDADKENYQTYYDLVLEKVNKGGIIIADNVLWSGKVVSGETDTESVALREFNRFVQHDERVENLLLPVRDGLMVIRKC